MKAKICDRCHETYVPRRSDLDAYNYRVSSVEEKLHLLDLCPKCIHELDEFMKQTTDRMDSPIPCVPEDTGVKEPVD